MADLTHTQHMERVESLGIPVVPTFIDAEPHHMGRVAWVLLMGLLTGKEAEADAFVEMVAQEVDRLKSLAQARPRRSMLWAWYRGGGNRWAVTQRNADAALIRDANAELVLGAEDLRRFFSDLSDGERQRVMIARALAQTPHLMVLDEITAFLDLPSRVEIMALLRSHAREKGQIVLLSSHDLDLSLQLSDSVWLLDDAGGFSVGTPDALSQSGAVGAFRDERAPDERAPEPLAIGILRIGEEALVWGPRHARHVEVPLDLGLEPPAFGQLGNDATVLDDLCAHGRKARFWNLELRFIDTGEVRSGVPARGDVVAADDNLEPGEPSRVVERLPGENPRGVARPVLRQEVA